LLLRNTSNEELNTEPSEEPSEEPIYILVLAEAHLVASIRERIINLLREIELYFDPEVDSHQYCPSQAFTESIPLDDPDYLPPPDDPDLQLEISWPFENDPSTSPTLNDASFTCPEHLSSLPSGLRFGPLVASMSDASPSKRRKTKGTPMKTKKSFGKQVAPC
jgi:hypothetical protein